VEPFTADDRAWATLDLDVDVEVEVEVVAFR
jgi:hypothetical protein